MNIKYDLVIIGSGSAARAAAYRCRTAGWSVAVVDYQPFGGTCALRGCDPKRVIIGAADAVDQARRLVDKGVRVAGLEINWSELIRFKRSFTDYMPKQIEESFIKQGIDTFHGQAKFAGSSVLAVADKVLEARYILIAAGAEPMALGIDGEQYLTTSDQFLEIGRLPQRIILVGGGFIAFELAHFLNRAGVSVTILEQAQRVLANFDRDLVKLLIKKSQAIGIDVKTSVRVNAIEKKGESFAVSASSDGIEKHFEADQVVHAAGRIPALRMLDLEAGKVEFDGHRLKLNHYLQSVSNPVVYAAGDAAAMGPALTPVTGYDGRLAAANMLEGNHLKVDYSIVPSAVFTIPPLASVGLTEEKARQQGLNIEVNYEETSSWYTNRRTNESVAGFKVLIDKDSRFIISAHLLGEHAEETINLFALAMKVGISAEQLKATLFAYPTAASDIEYMV